MSVLDDWHEPGDDFRVVHARRLAKTAAKARRQTARKTKPAHAKWSEAETATLCGHIADGGTIVGASERLPGRSLSACHERFAAIRRSYGEQGN